MRAVALIMHKNRKTKIKNAPFRECGSTHCGQVKNKNTAEAAAPAIYERAKTDPGPCVSQSVPVSFRNTSPPVYLSVRIRHSAPQCEEHKTSGKTKDTRDRGCGPCVSKPQKQGGAVAPPCVRNQRHRKQKTQKTPVAGAVALACLKNEAKNSAMSNGSKKGQVARAFSKRKNPTNKTRAQNHPNGHVETTHPRMDMTARQPVQCKACGSGGGLRVPHTVPVGPPV